MAKQMTKEKIWVQYNCKKCNHTWIPRGPSKPKSCPNCKRYDWNKDKTKSKEETKNDNKNIEMA